MSTAEARAARRPWDGVGVLLATAGGIGFLKPAPGTWASAAAAVLAWAWWQQAGGPSQPWLLVAATVASLACLVGAGAAVRRTGIQDPGIVVMDEVAGMWLAMGCLPSRLLAIAPTETTLVAFLLFRAFDIGKPWPLTALERLPGAYGILLDDLAAGLLAGMLTLAAFH